MNRHGCPQGARSPRVRYRSNMRAVLKSNNPVTLSFAANLLSQEGIENIVFDENASVMDGSMGFVQRRLMVADDDFARAGRLLKAAMPGEFL